MTFYVKGQRCGFIRIRSKEAMASFKYEGCYENAAFFAEEFIRFRKEKLLAWKPDFLIPVPLHRHRRWFRGYNQAEILAEEIGEAVTSSGRNRCLVPKVSIRVRKSSWMIRRDTGICQVLSMFRRVPVIS